MARKKLSEYAGKTLLSKYTGVSYAGVEVIKGKKMPKLKSSVSYVVKVDQAEKGRGKKGLVRLNRTASEAISDAKEFFNKGYSYALIEPFKPHKDKDENYLSLSLLREGIILSHSSMGGVDVEKSKKIEAFKIAGPADLKKAVKKTKVPQVFLESLLEFYNKNFVSFLEINPLIVEDGKVHILDLAIEVDDAASFFVESWSSSDFRSPRQRETTKPEHIVQQLNRQSPASFRFEILNPKGRFFMLLSGGGASVTLADEVHNLGLGDQLANYGEYSGNPNREETKIYTLAVLDSLLESDAKNKVLIIGGGVANFTDVAVTFNGIIDALRLKEAALRRDGVKIYVRRGGPNEAMGLKRMLGYLKSSRMLGAVHGSEKLLTDVIAEASGVKNV